MEQVTAFKASDGTFFGSADECQEHELVAKWRTLIDKFNKSGCNPYSSGVHATMCNKTIAAWERFKAHAPDAAPMSIYDLGLGIRSLNCLRAEDVLDVPTLIKMTRNDVLRIPNFGRNCLIEVIERLKVHGFFFAGE